MNIRIRGREGDVEQARGANEDSQYHGPGNPLQPRSWYAKRILEWNDLERRSDGDLLDRAFGIVRKTKYGNAIFERFKSRSGETLTHRIDVWHSDVSTSKRDLLEAISRKIAAHHVAYHFGKINEIDVSPEIRANRPSFRFSPLNPSETIAMGGVQEIEIASNRFGESRGGDYWDRNGHIHNHPHTARYGLDILLKDWFGVSENDFTNFRPAALLDRVGIAALWVLQHQRGYRPFVNVFGYSAYVDVNFGAW